MAASKQLKSRQLKMLIFLGLVLGELAFCGVLLVGIKNGGQEKIQRSLQEKVDVGQRVLGREAQIQKTFKEGYAELEKLGDFVPKSSDPYAWTYEYISLRARRVSIALKEVKEVKLGGEDAKNQIYRVQLAMNVSYESITDFLVELEKDNPLLLIAQLEINEKVSTPTEHSVKLLLQWPLGFTIETGK